MATRFALILCVLGTVAWGGCARNCSQVVHRYLDYFYVPEPSCRHSGPPPAVDVAPMPGHYPSHCHETAHEVDGQADPMRGPLDVPPRAAPSDAAPADQVPAADVPSDRRLQEGLPATEEKLREISDELPTIRKGDPVLGQQRPASRRFSLGLWPPLRGH